MCAGGFECYEADTVVIGSNVFSGTGPVLQCYPDDNRGNCERDRTSHNGMNTGDACVYLPDSNACVFTGPGTIPDDNPSTQTDQYCFEPTHTTSGNRAEICFDEFTDCNAARLVCNNEVATCSIDTDTAACNQVFRDAPTGGTSGAAFVAALNQIIPGLGDRLSSSSVAGMSSVTNTSGQSGSTSSDRDGDGIPNSLDSCPNNPNTGDDEDGDGIDSACDGDDNDNSVGATPSSQTGTTTANTTRVINCEQEFGSPYCLKDPLTENENCFYNFETNQEECFPNETNTIFSLIYLAVTGLTNILIPLSVLFIIWAGLRYVAARGNESKVKEANKTLTNVVIGVGLIIGARVLVEIVYSIVNSL